MTEVFKNYISKNYSSIFILKLKNIFFSGFLNGSIFFTRASLSSSSYHPRRGDLVLYVSVECEPSAHNKHSNWRAIRITPKSNTLRSKPLNLDNLSSPAQRDLRADLIANKNGIVVVDCLDLGTVTVGKVREAKLVIDNTGVEDQILQDCFHAPSVRMLGTFPLTLHKQSSKEMDIVCKARHLGRNREILVLRFAGFEIGVGVTFSAVDSDDLLREITPSGFNGGSYQKQHYGDTTSRSSFANGANVVPGRRKMFRPRQRAFATRRLGDYPVPNYMWRDALEAEEASLLDAHPTLGEPLSRENYKDKLSSLLHLEEIANDCQIKRFGIREAVFTRASGDMLSLQVPGLSEKRPSLMIGDSAMAKPVNSGMLGDDRWFEGCVQEVRSTSVLLLFEQSFHNSYCGEVYEVEFKLNRGGFRRMHQAVDVACELMGNDILFPEKVGFKLN